MNAPLDGLLVRAADEASARWAGALLALLGAEREGLTDTKSAANTGSSSAPCRTLLAAELERSGSTQAVAVHGEPSEPDRDWALSGGMWLTGYSHGPALPAQGAPATAARGALLAMQLLSSFDGPVVRLDGRRLLGERAAFAGLRRAGRTSPGGSARLVRAADGWLVLSLPRDDDLDAVPALTETAGVTDPWTVVRSWARRRPAADAARRAHLLGMAAAPVPRAGPEHRRAKPFVLGPGQGRAMRRREPALVVDLSSLWAGPLCAHLLGLTGVRVVKVESVTRPDGARFGDSHFFDLLHGGHESAAVDFRTTAGRRALNRLLARADLVLTSSRARAMQQLGIDVAGLVCGGTSWLHITAYGRAHDRVGFGDDVAAGAGLVATDPVDGTPLICGDALADPLTGVHAAVAALACLMDSDARLIEVPMHAVVTAVRHGIPWRATVPAAEPAVAPVARIPVATAHPLGHDTAAVLGEVP